jgi:hypothetical protein
MDWESAIMTEYTNLSLEHILSMITTGGLRLYELLKGNLIAEFRMLEIEKMFKDAEIREKAEEWLERFEEAVADINENTDMRVAVEIDGEMVRFKRMR